MIGPWIVREAPVRDEQGRESPGREIMRGGDWPAPGVAAVVRVLRSVPCGGPKPHTDPNGDRDGWRTCGAEVERTREGDPTGRCARCRLREQDRRIAAAHIDVSGAGDGARPTMARRTG